MRVIVLGGDGFCGWPTSLHLADRGHTVMIVDNLSRRMIDVRLGVESLTPILPIGERLKIWNAYSANRIEYANIDIARSYDGLRDLLARFEPDAVVHFAEQRAAPYSMKSTETKRYTVDNNVRGTHNLLVALAELGLDAHVA
jgi:UDP-sulfoquinovose synthase